MKVTYLSLTILLLSFFSLSAHEEGKGKMGFSLLAHPTFLWTNTSETLFQNESTYVGYSIGGNVLLPIKESPFYFFYSGIHIERIGMHLTAVGKPNISSVGGGNLQMAPNDKLTLAANTIRIPTSVVFRTSPLRRLLVYGNVGLNHVLSYSGRYTYKSQNANTGSSLDNPGEYNIGFLVETGLHFNLLNDFWVKGGVRYSQMLTSAFRDQLPSETSAKINGISLVIGLVY